MIDAHVHLWTLGAHGCVWPTAADGVLHRDVTLAEILALLDTVGIDRALLVQSQEDARDTAWLLEVAASSDRIAGVVGWADLADRAGVAALAANPRLRGLRPMVQGREADWYDDPARDAGLALMAERGLVLDALIRSQHLPALDRLAARHPTLAIVIDHAAKPAGIAGLPAWQAALAPLARHRQVHVKLSGLLSELPRAGVEQAVATLIELFGTARLLWGSDWPVLGAVAGYQDWLDLARALIPAADRAAVFGGNGARVYGVREMADA